MFLSIDKYDTRGTRAPADGLYQPIDNQAKYDTRGTRAPADGYYYTLTFYPSQYFQSGSTARRLAGLGFPDLK